MAPPPPPPRQSRFNQRVVIGILAAGMAVLVLCCGLIATAVIIVQRSGVLSGPDAPPVTSQPPDDIEWWVLGEDTRSGWDSLAEQFTADHGVKVTVDSVAPEDYWARLDVTRVSGNMPDIVPARGGDELRRLVREGQVRDLTDELADVIATLSPATLAPYSVDGRVYGLPYQVQPVGIWYNRTLFQQAGLDPDEPPETWDDFLTVVKELQQAGITPVAIAGGDPWTVSYWYGHLVTRIVGADGVTEAIQQRSLLVDPGFLEAAEMLADFIELEPFQANYRNASYNAPGGQADLVGSGQAAMELMGTWAPAVHAGGGSSSFDDDPLGWVPFPAVEGGRGSADIMGGAEGFMVAAGASDAAIELLRFLYTDSVYSRLPVLDQTSVSVLKDAPVPDDPSQQAQLTAVQQAPSMQLYLDAELPRDAAMRLHDVMQLLLFGYATPQDVVEQLATP